MTVLQPRVLAAHRLARWLDNPDVPRVAEALAELTDPATRSLVAKSIRAVAFNEVLDALEPSDDVSAFVIADIQRRVFVGARERLQGIFPDDILEEAFA